MDSFFVLRRYSRSRGPELVEALGDWQFLSLEVDHSRLRNELIREVYRESYRELSSEGDYRLLSLMSQQGY